MAFEKIYMEISPGEVLTPLAFGKVDIVKVVKPSYDYYRSWHDEVGRQWNWHLRPRINNRAVIETMLQEPRTEMGIFLSDKSEIGYYLYVGDKPNELELSDFGFTTEHLHRGFGRRTLPNLLNKTFEKGVSRIWLSTRSTNDPRVPIFYEKIGFRIYKIEKNDA